ncbi:MAG TPA: YceI family protein [Bacteroidales bacterium]|nr:YceI family protein [Bacteroidales bacterium]
MNWIVSLLLFFPFTLFGGSRQMFSYSIQPGSEITIAGKTNISQFVCWSSGETPTGSFLIEKKPGCNIIRFSDATLKIGIGTFDCGNRLMNRDMHQAMGSKDHPDIVIQIIEGVPISLNQPSNSGNANLFIAISLNGITRHSFMLVEYTELINNQLKVFGSKQLRMTDFGITPPSPAFGLAKVKDEVTIQMTFIIQTSLIGQK